MGKRFDKARILIYSHDTFGLGHLRRCRTIAHSLVGEHKGLSVLIISGSPIIGAYEFRARVDFVRVPGIIKLRNGDYSSLSLQMDVGQLLELRASIITHTAEVFRPHLFIVDKEPLGLRGEIADALALVRAQGTPTVLGLRDVMDEPHLLAREWERKGLIPALDELYDDIWVYGLPQVCDPLEGVGVSDSVRQKMIYTGYLRTQARSFATTSVHGFEEPYVLVTTGGGGDGEELIDWVLSAYESDPKIPHPALLLLGPFMPLVQRTSYIERAERLEKVKTLTFDASAEQLINGALGVIAMGGYNTFCEILSFDKRSLIVPRTRPRLEQFIRACRAEELGLVRMLSGDDRRDPRVMANAIRALADQPKPSEAVVPGLLEGLDNIHRLVARWLEAERVAPDNVASLPGHGTHS